ncbi:MAG: Gfo/Idh/MocA family oxidoreductase [Opitutaceae bacterium]|nr:Gfo/Idh/MocA family oxidoreductase [Opitutaceae bacterium]
MMKTSASAKIPLTRRAFLRASTSAAAAFTILPGRMRGGVRQLSANDKLNIAGIGIGAQGSANIATLASENIVALCDVDHGYTARTIAKYPDAKLYVDYRKMLEKQKDIDAVVVATPDHTHAVITLAAMQAGKHVYCQKPLCHDVHEARTLTQAARESKVCTQMGIQGHSGEGLRLITEWIADGAIGEVREVDAYCSLTYYPWGHASWSSKWGRRPADTPPLPDKLNWDLWLGPAPERAYHPAYHPRVWRCWWDFGNGMMGDRGAHTLDSAVTALKLGPPTSIEATSSDLNPDTHPISSVITFRFPARGNLPPVKLTWYEGTRAPRPVELEDGRRMPEQGGIIFKGSKGCLMAGVYGEGARLIPESKMQGYNRPEKSMPRVVGTHEKEWVDAAKAGRKANAGFEYSGPLTEICLLGNVAKRVDARIEWDAANLAITNLPEANQYIRPEYRNGWTI